MTMFSSAARLPERVRGMFNLNDPRWGRDDTPQDNGGSPEGGEPPQRPPQDQPPRGRGPNQGPPDLDELWRDFNRRLTGMFEAAAAVATAAGVAAAVTSSPT